MTNDKHMPRLVRTDARREWVNNAVSAKPASWRVEGTNITLDGRAGSDAPYYDLRVDGVVVERGIRSFRYAKAAAIAKATGESA